MTDTPFSAATPATDPLPAWAPAWARELAATYFSGTSGMFVLHGNVRDLIAIEDAGRTRYVSLMDYLATEIFGAWDLVVGYDLSRGLRAAAGADAARFARWSTR
ncbi:MAG: hypothetical protein QM811_04645 [Pirellulales bacterium]